VLLLAHNTITAFFWEFTLNNGYSRQIEGFGR